MPHIIPIKDLKNTSDISELCHKSTEPIYVTKNGYGDMVLMSMEMYEDTMSRMAMYRELDISAQQKAENKVRSARASLSEMREKYGL